MSSCTFREELKPKVKALMDLTPEALSCPCRNEGKNTFIGNMLGELMEFSLDIDADPLSVCPETGHPPLEGHLCAMRMLGCFLRRVTEKEGAKAHGDDVLLIMLSPIIATVLAVKATTYLNFSIFEQPLLQEVFCKMYNLVFRANMQKNSEGVYSEEDRVLMREHFSKRVKLFLTAIDWKVHVFSKNALQDIEWFLENNVKCDMKNPSCRFYGIPSSMKALGDKIKADACFGATLDRSRKIVLLLLRRGFSASNA